MPEKFSGHERRLYIFGCRRKTCRRKDGSIRGVRGSRVTKAIVPETKKPVVVEESTKPAIDIGATLFGGPTAPGANAPVNPFSTNAQSALVNPFAAMSSMASKPAQRPAADLPETFASKARISESASATAPTVPRPHEPWPTADKLPPTYPEFYLDAEYETLSAPPTPKLSEAVPDIDEGEGNSGGGAEDKELFESVMDKTFDKFATRMAQNPEQTIRYEFGGTPLLYSDTDVVGKLLGTGGQKSGAKITTQASDGSKVPRCMNCGSGRLFEVQMTPHAITVLEEDEMILDGMEWGTVILFVCSKDCSPSGTAVGQVGYAEETVFIQWEELAGKRR
jgi:pre-rRNA-processing protein TSR4